MAKRVRDPEPPGPVERAARVICGRNWVAMIGFLGLLACWFASLGFFNGHWVAVAMYAPAAALILMSAIICRAVREELRMEFGLGRFAMTIGVAMLPIAICALNLPFEARWRLSRGAFESLLQDPAEPDIRKRCGFFTIRELDPIHDVGLCFMVRESFTVGFVTDSVAHVIVHRRTDSSDWEASEYGFYSIDDWRSLSGGWYQGRGVSY